MERLLCRPANNSKHKCLSGKGKSWAIRESYFRPSHGSFFQIRGSLGPRPSGHRIGKTETARSSSRKDRDRPIVANEDNQVTGRPRM
eukprot:914997-Pyramimonas_sp.AAC.1